MKSLPLPKTRWFEQELEIGFEYKSSNNNLEFGGAQVFDTTTEVYQFVLRHSLIEKDRFGATSLSTSGYWSPGDFSAHNRDSVFRDSRGGADADYLYANVDLERLVNLPYGWSLQTRAEGQLSDGNLLASEQMYQPSWQSQSGRTAPPHPSSRYTRDDSSTDKPDQCLPDD